MEGELGKKGALLVNDGEGGWICVTRYRLQDGNLVALESWDLSSEVDEVITNSMRMAVSPATRVN